MPANGQLVKEMLAPSKTQTYTPSRSVVSGYAWYDDENGPLTYWDIERMLRGDGHIRFCLRALAAPIKRATWTVYARSQEVAKFVDAQVKQFWEQDLPNIIPSKFAWGTRSGEKLFKKNQNRHIVLDRLKVIHPFDVRPLMLRGEWWGVEITGLETGSIILDKVKSFHFVHEDEYNTLYGQSRLHCVRPIWQEKRDQKGAVPARRAWFSKYAFRGGVMYVPRGGEVDPGMGNREISYMDNARQMLELSEAGSIFIIPDHRDEKGNRTWEMMDAKGNDHPPMILEYIQELDREITRAIGIPPEVLEATGATGSGFAGRAIPKMVFDDEADGEMKQQMRDYKRQIGDYLVRANFGPEPYRIECDSSSHNEMETPGNAARTEQRAAAKQQPTNPLRPKPMIGMSLEVMDGWGYASRGGQTFDLKNDLDGLALSLGGQLEVVHGLEEQLTDARRELVHIKEALPLRREFIELGIASEETVLVAVYGTLRDGQVRHRALGHASTSEKASVLNYERAGTAEFPNLTPKPGSEVDVEVFPADRWDIEKLMRYEHQDNYRPEKVQVRMKDGQVRDAMMFVLAQGGGTESEDGDTPESKSQAIAQLLSGIYGDGAQKMLAQVEHGTSTAQMSFELALWDPNLHPRAKAGEPPHGGEFIPKHGAAAHEIVGQKIKAAIEKRDAGSMADLLNHLNLLTAKQILDVAQQHGLSGVKRQGKSQLAQAVYTRLTQGQYQPQMFGEEEPKQPANPEPKKLNGMDAARKQLAAGTLPIKGNATSEVLKSDVSGEPIRRHVTLESGHRVHPDELHRLNEQGELGPENIKSKDKYGEYNRASFAPALAFITRSAGQDGERITLTTPHGYMVTKTRGEWRQIASQYKGGSMGSWYDQNNPEVESEAAKSAPGGATIASDKETAEFFQPAVQQQESMFDHKTKALPKDKPKE